jgi:hypothetical protein
MLCWLLLTCAALPARGGEPAADITILSGISAEDSNDAPPSPAADKLPAAAPMAQPAHQPAALPAAEASAAAPAVAAAPRQPAVFAPPAARPPFAPQPIIDAQLSNHARQVVGVYGGPSARATLSRLPRRAPVQPGAAPALRPTKPFEIVHQEPTVSPYMNLYRDDETTDSAPNYYAFVRPQLEQLDANRVQQREIQMLRGQLQSVSAGAAGPQYQPAPNTGAARYMDTAQFYSGWRR